MSTEVVTHPYDWNIEKDAGTGNTVIYCWSLDRDSKPYLLRFPNFDIFCYVELPLVLNNSFVNWNGYRKQLVFDSICEKLGDDRPHRYMLVYREKIYFYKGQNKKYPMLLLCFHSVDQMMKCRNKLKFPFKVRGLKGGKDLTTISVKVWETHIPVERKLLTLRNMRYTQWFKVQGKLVTGGDKISTLEREYIADWRTMTPIDTEETVSWITHPRIVSFDLETYSDRHNAMPDALNSKHVIYLVSVVYQEFLRPETREKKIVLLGDCSETELAHVIKVKTELELLDKLQDLLVEYDPEVVTGYNIFGYDNPYMEDRLKRKLKDWRSLGRLLETPSQMKTISWSSSAYKNQDFTILDMAGRISIDMLPVIRRDYKLSMYKLDYVANYFLKKGKHDVTPQDMFAAYELQLCLSDDYDPNTASIPVNFSREHKDLSEDEVRRLWVESHRKYALDEMKRVVDYCVVDSDLVIDLFEKINVWIGLIQMANIVGIKPSDIFTRGTGVRMISQVYDEASKSGVVMDEVEMPDTHIEGGFVYDGTPGIYHNIPCFDFKSLYPNIQISENMDHTSLVPPDRMDLIADEECNVIEWDEEEDDDSDSDECESPSNIKKKKEKKIVHHKYKFVKKPEGIMPRLLRRLIAARNAVRKKQKGLDKNSLEWNVLEQTQLSIKISCNSFYGACSSGFSKLSLKIIGKCITAKARESTRKMNAYLESKGHSIVYGDSVTGDTPVLIRRGGWERYVAIEEIVNDWSDPKNREDKQYVVPEGLDVWSDQGYTRVLHVMRHRCRKQIYCVVTRSGIVKVTEDHSLLLATGHETTPREVKIGDVLMTKTHPIGMKLVENKVVVKLACKNGLAAIKAIQNYDKNYVTYRYDQGNYYLTVSDQKVENPGEIVDIVKLGFTDDYVYDLETENHHFAAGVGELVVHNTDSTMPDLGIKDPLEANKLGAVLADELTAMYTKPMCVEHEMTYHTMLFIKKKFYICIVLGDDGKPLDTFDEWKIRGVTLARRDNCPFQREFYKNIAWKVLHAEPFVPCFDYIVDQCIGFMSRAVKIEDLIMIKGLGSHYKNANYMMNIFAKEMEKSGNPLVAGDRVQYLMVDTGNPDEKVGYKMRTLELFKARARSQDPEHLDYIYYLEKTIRNGIEKQLFQICYREELKQLRERHEQRDVDRFIKALGNSLYMKEPNQQLREIKEKGFQIEVNRLREKYRGIELAQALLDDEKYTKIAKPLYNFHVKRRLGRVRRLSTRVDEEPIMMMVRLFKQKALVMQELRDKANGYVKNPVVKKQFTVSKKVQLKIITPTEWIKKKGEEMRAKCNP